MYLVILIAAWIVVNTVLNPNVSVELILIFIVDYQRKQLLNLIL